MPEAARRPGFSLEDAVLDIGGDIGALILYTDAAYLGREIEVSLIDGLEPDPGLAQHHSVHDEHGHSDGREHGARRVHTAIHERRAGSALTYAGIYSELEAGTYRVWIDDPTLPDRVTIIGGEVAELDWRTGRA